MHSKYAGSWREGLSNSVRVQLIMRVVYLQLPVLDFGYDYAAADHPLAGGYLAASALANAVKHEPIFLPQALSSFASTRALVREILSLEPHVVVATLYLWNVDRTIRVARALKESNPRIWLLAGGPEAAGDFQDRFPHHPFDLVHCGEGEQVFPLLLGEISKDPEVNREKLAAAKERARPAMALDEIPSPYLMGLLPQAPDGSIWVETMRGCPYHCAYCYYGKSLQELRWFPAQWVKNHLLWASGKGVKEIYFLDPSFQVTPGLAQRLEELARWNALSIPLHTEARVDRVDSTLADGFKKAGFHSLETGLQSIHSHVLRKVGRPGRPLAFAKGAHLLLERGVQLQIDVILGLPGDTSRGFLETVDFLGEQGLGEHVTIFPLLVLPGTRLKERAPYWGVKYRPSPPYQVEAVGEMGIEELRNALEQAERRLDLGLYPLHLPDLSPSEGPFDLIGLVEIHEQQGGSLPGLAPELMDSLAQSPVFLFRSGSHEPPWSLISQWGQWQKKFLPDLLPFWGMEAQRRFPLRNLQKLLKELHDPGSYQAGLWSLCPDDYLRLSCRPFLLSRCDEDPAFWLELDQLIPVIRVVHQMPFFQDRDPLRKLPVLWETPRLISRKILQALQPLFQGREEELLFSRKENTIAWAAITGISLPPGKPRMGRVRLP